MSDQPGKAPEDSGRRKLVSVLSDVRDIVTSIGGIVTVVVTTLSAFGVGFTVGRNSAPSQPASNPPAAAASHQPSSSAPVLPPTSSVSTTTPSQAGALVASYSFVWPNGNSAPIRDSAPTQSQFDPTAVGGDLYYIRGLDTFQPIGTTHLFGLEGNATPSYQLCKKTPIIIRDNLNFANGTTFCLTEPGRMVGMSVTGISQVDSVTTVSLSVVVWTDPPA